MATEKPAAEPKPDPAPKVSVRDRRILARLQNPYGEPSAPIRFKEANRIARWFNAAIIEDKIFRAKEKGWNLVYEADLLDKDQLGGYTLDPAGGHVVRGDRGREVLMWMDRQDYQEVQMAKARHNNRHIGDPVAQHRDVVEAASRQLGDEAADFLNRRGGLTGKVIDKKEILERID